MSRRPLYVAIIACLASLAVSALAATDAYAAPLETSRAVAKVYSDIHGKVIVRTKYRTLGPLVKPVKVCVHDRPSHTAHTIRVTWRQAFRQVDMGEYKPGTVCKRLPLHVRRWSRAYTWDAWGLAVVWRIGPVGLISDSFYVKGRMR